ncbi:MAG: hypothetical protein WCC66_13095 [Rhizobiaceae bacterium]
MAGFTPFAEPDPLDEIAGTDRLRPADGILLTADHVQTEQLYHRGRLARLLAYLHGAGTVAGLDVRYSAPGGTAAEVQVTPGLAIDYRGRLVELTHLSCLKLGDWVGATASTPQGLARLAAGRRAAGAGLPDHLVVDLFAEFRAFARRPEPAFATGNADRIDAISPTLAQDSVFLNMVIRDAAFTGLPESMVSRLVPGAVTAAEVQRVKRESLWPALGPRPDQLAPDPTLPPTEHVRGHQAFGGVFLARLRVPVTGTPPGLDDSIALTAPALLPDVSGRLYSYSTAELALLAGQRR